MNLTKNEEQRLDKNNILRRGKSGGNMGSKRMKQGVCQVCDIVLFDSSQIRKHQALKHEVTEI